MRRIHWTLPALFITWIGSSLLVLWLWGHELPVEITNVLSLSLIPFLPSIPLLKTLGLTSGEAWTLPSFPGFILVSIIYCLIPTRSLPKKSYQILKYWEISGELLAVEPAPQAAP